MWPGRACKFFLVRILLMSYGIAYAAGDVSEDRVMAEVGKGSKMINFMLATQLMFLVPRTTSGFDHVGLVFTGTLGLEFRY